MEAGGQGRRAGSVVMEVGGGPCSRSRVRDLGQATAVAPSLSITVCQHLEVSAPLGFFFLGL